MGEKMERFILVDYQNPDVEFDGWFRNFVSSRRKNSIHWIELHVYETKGGKWVLHTLRFLHDREEPQKAYAKIYESPQEMIEDLGWNGIRSKLFRRLGWHEYAGKVFVE